MTMYMCCKDEINCVYQSRNNDDCCNENDYRYYNIIIVIATAAAMTTTTTITAIKPVISPASRQCTRERARVNMRATPSAVSCQAGDLLFRESTPKDLLSRGNPISKAGCRANNGGGRIFGWVENSVCG